MPSLISIGEHVFSGYLPSKVQAYIKVFTVTFSPIWLQYHPTSITLLRRHHQCQVLEPFQGAAVEQLLPLRDLLPHPNPPPTGELLTVQAHKDHLPVRRYATRDGLRDSQHVDQSW